MFFGAKNFFMRYFGNFRQFIIFLNEIATRSCFFSILSLIDELSLRCVRIFRRSNTCHELKLWFTMGIKLTKRITLTRRKHKCLAQGHNARRPGEAWTCNPSNSSLAPYHHGASLHMYLKVNFFISQQKGMLSVLKRTVSIRWFFWVPKTHVKTDRLEDNNIFTLKSMITWTYVNTI